MPRFSRFLLLAGLLAGALGAGPAAQAQSPTDAAPAPRMTRQERRALNQRLKQEQQRLAAHPPLSARERELSEALFTDGVKYCLLEDYPKALERLLKAYTLMPDNAAVNYKLAEANLLSGNAREATAYAEAAVRLDPKNAYYYLLLAQVQASQKLYEAATATYASLVREVPGAGTYLFQLADLYLVQNKLPEALATLEKAQAQFGNLDEISFKKQQIYLRQNNLPLALAEGEKLMAANPGEVRYVLAQAEMYAANNRPADARRVAEQALRLDPGNPPARLILADVLRRQGQPEAANQQLRLAFDSPALPLEQALRLLAGFVKQLPDPKLEPLALELAALTVRHYPRESRAHAMAGDVQVQAGRKADARAAYARAVRLDRSKFALWQQVVGLDYELNQLDSLRLHTDQGLETFPNQASLWFYNGLALSAKKQYPAAQQALEHGRRLVFGNASQQTQFDALLGDVYHNLKDYPRADAAFDNVLAADPDNYGVLNNYAYYLALRGEKLKKAEEMSARTIERFPDNETYLDTYAWVLYKMGDYGAARQKLAKIVPKTKDAGILEHYGDVLWQLGDRAGALAAWQRAKRAGPGASPLLDRKIKDQKLYE